MYIINIVSIFFFFGLQRKRLVKMTVHKKKAASVTSEVHRPDNWFILIMYKISISLPFEIIIFLVVIVNAGVTVAELVIEYTETCAGKFEEENGDVMRICNYVFIGIYTLEAAIKVQTIEYCDLGFVLKFV